MAELHGPSRERSVVYVIDDDASIRSALDDLLSSVGLEARTYASVAEFMGAQRPDVASCVVLDVRMPGQGGLDFQQAMKRSGSELPIIFITGHGDVEMSVRAMKSGAVDFLSKPFRDQDLLDAIQTALQRDMARREVAGHLDQVLARYSTLTSGERDVMQLVTAGRLNKQIAGELGLSEITVKVRRAQVMRKMGAQTLPDLVRLADLIRQSSGPDGV
ncbi:MAG: response regulator transcription factor [Proteobacteria bacterium]|nr:response regulator transcription factor [Pseudomonadota bacterium]